MQKETKQCQNCKKDFTIEPEDFNFYEKMKVKAPEFCSDCGLQRITALRNERVVYWRNCSKCGKKTMSLYHPSYIYTIYCHECWWGDDWDGLEYGINYDLSKTLINQIPVLQKGVPREALIILNSTNCTYGNNVRDSKNCFFTFLCTNSENILYSMWIDKSKDCIEDHKVIESELVMNSIDVSNSYKSAYLQDSSDCSFCYFSYDLKNCNNCIFCYNLRNKSYCVRNKQVTKEEYEKEYKKIFDGSFKTVTDSLREFEDLKQKAIHKFAFILKSNSTIGNYLQNSNRNYWCFDGIGGQDVKYVSNNLGSKSSYFSYATGPQPTEFLFGSCVIKGGSMIKNSFNLFNCSFCDWCDSLISCSNCIGCIGLKKKEYCILNKQYSKEEYEKLKKEIEKKGDLANFINPQFSTFAYNETAAFDHFPMGEKEILKTGYKWQPDVPFTKGQETILTENIPDNIKYVNNEVLREIFACIKCKRNYKITAEELNYLKEFLLPLPRECPQCRMKNRREARLPFKLWHRKCMKPNCPNEFETSYAPERPEIVYCEKCYNQEVY